MSNGVVWDMSSLFKKFNGPDMVKFRNDMKKGFAEFQKAASTTAPLNAKNQAKWEKLFLDARSFLQAVPIIIPILIVFVQQMHLMKNTPRKQQY